MVTDPVLLFRYSALTFSVHGIHQNSEFATNEEFYPCLIVHGWLIATVLLGVASRTRSGTEI